MKNDTIRIGLDVGGSHVTASIIDVHQKGNLPLQTIRKNIDSTGDAYAILEIISLCIKDLVSETSKISTLGIAFPGPFNYTKGVSAIANVGGKFEKTFGLHIHQALLDFVGLTDTRIGFANDAHCFAVGAYHRHQLDSKQTVFLTLGTGFGSAFMKNGRLLYHDTALPKLGAFYDEDFLSAKADDYFSTRWILNEYKKRGGSNQPSVKEIAEENSSLSKAIFEEFGSNLGRFLLPWLERFECTELIMGGNIAKAAPLFDAALQKALGTFSQNLNIVYSDDTEECILTGAILLADQNESPKATEQRNTTQALLPIALDETQQNAYNIYPSVHTDFTVFRGYKALAQKICSEKTVVIDGYGGVLWEKFRTSLHQELRAMHKTVFWYDIDSCLKPAHDIEALIADNLNGNDPVFGKKYSGDMLDFFDTQKLSLIQPDLQADICIIYGTGAALSAQIGYHLYIDVPKNEIQYRMRAGSVTNLGATELSAKTQMYKRFYFVDWVVLNKHKEALLPKIDIIIDEQRIYDITWMLGDAFRASLSKMLCQPLRARPWFEAGVWGGQWMKNKIHGLNKNEKNFAWSFELITPENGIVIEGAGYLLEVSFDFLLFYDNKKLLGKAADRFGTEFPIRFDFLDTFDGGNLSVQCHPRTAYIQEHFGESFTQDETYYILDCTSDAKVYLGFQEDINPDRFKKVLLDAQKNGTEIATEQYIQEHDAHKHDLFLIPSGTIHASGKNNMVLEISNTPYIFTFKMYDWQRLDLNGQPRPINIEHAFKNLQFDRKGDYVPQKLISKPQVVEEWATGRKLRLPTHEEHFYAIDRYEFTGSHIIETCGQCHICMLVEGQTIDVIVQNETSRFFYAETFVMPANIEKYTVISKEEKRAYIVVAYVKTT